MAKVQAMWVVKSLTQKGLLKKNQEETKTIKVLHQTYMLY